MGGLLVVANHCYQIAGKNNFKMKLTVLISRIRKPDCIRIAVQSIPLDNEFVIRASQCIQINLEFGRE